jgi:hypothetical protein
MFSALNNRLSIMARIALVGGVFVDPVLIAMSIIVIIKLSLIDFATKEQAGRDYIEQIWPSIKAHARSDGSRRGASAARCVISRRDGHGRAARHAPWASRRSRCYRRGSGRYRPAAPARPTPRQVIDDEIELFLCPALQGQQ